MKNNSNSSKIYSGIYDKDTFFPSSNVSIVDVFTDKLFNEFNKPNTNQ